MSLRTLLASAFLSLGLLGTADVASAEPGPVQAFLRGPYFQPSASTLRIFPPAGGHVMLHRDGKPVRWFLQPAAIRVEPGVTYALTAVKDDRVVFDSGIVARPGILDVSWGNVNDAPVVAFHAPVAQNPFAVGLVPIGSAPVQALRTPIGDNAYQLMLDDLQLQPNDQARWMAFTRYAQTWLFTEAQAQGITASFTWPLYQAQVANLLARRLAS